MSVEATCLVDLDEATYLVDLDGVLDTCLHVYYEEDELGTPCYVNHEWEALWDAPLWSGVVLDKLNKEIGLRVVNRCWKHTNPTVAAEARVMIDTGDFYS